MLRDLELNPVYDSATHDLVADLIIPLLSNSRLYLRGVGFFTSGWLRVAARGVVKLVENGGIARIVLSPHLEQSDWQAFQLGEKAKRDALLRDALRKNIDELAVSLERDTLNALAWMIADGVLEFRFAVPRKAHDCDYHDKVAVFLDERQDRVAIHGSFNDSIKGTLNGEAFSVFKSWDVGQQEYVEMHHERLCDLWDGNNAQFEAVKIPDAIREKFIQLRSTPTRPYSLADPPDATHEEPSEQMHSTVKLHGYQNKAIEAWVSHGCRGIFEMATGTGKTYTSLAAAQNRMTEMGRLSLIILVPYLHLLEQWETNCRKFGFAPILCSSAHDRWNAELRPSVQEFNLRAIDRLCVLAVHKTASSERFARSVSKLRAEHTMVIADEVHCLGSRHLREALNESAGLRLGLSATPRRWFDDEGTDAILDYFGGVCYEYPLSEAIGRYLTPYEYYPELVQLTSEEMAAYAQITSKIVSVASKAQKDATASETLRQLLIQRARILSSAENKLPKMLSVLHRMAELERQKDGEISGVLVYCAPGKHREVLKAVSDLGLRCHEFVHTVPLAEREQLLQLFAAGDIQVLVAIKCLDEGVDVPSTKTAFILASSTNPREFVQRRGRILRVCDGKSKATIYDFVVIPPEEAIIGRGDVAVSLLRREMPRFAEFASLALNEFQARSAIRNILDRLEILPLLEAKPWDIYGALPDYEREDND